METKERQDIPLEEKIAVVADLLNGIYKPGGIPLPVSYYYDKPSRTHYLNFYRPINFPDSSVHFGATGVVLQSPRHPDANKWGEYVAEAFHRAGKRYLFGSFSVGNPPDIEGDWLILAQQYVARHTASRTPVRAKTAMPG